MLFVREERRRQQLPGADARGDRPDKSVRVISAVELVKQTSQGDKADPETNDHEPPSEDGSQDDGHESE